MAVKVAIIIEDGFPTIYSNEDLDLTVVDLDTDDREEALKTLKEVEDDKDYTYSWSY